MEFNIITIESPWIFFPLWNCFGWKLFKFNLKILIFFSFENFLNLVIWFLAFFPLWCFVFFLKWWLSHHIHPRCRMVAAHQINIWKSPDAIHKMNLIFCNGSVPEHMAMFTRFVYDFVFGVLFVHFVIIKHFQVVLLQYVSLYLN